MRDRIEKIFLGYIFPFDSYQIMKIPELTSGKLIGLAAVLVGVAVFFHYVLGPVYTNYQLSSCLQNVEDSYRKQMGKECSDRKPQQLNVCLWAAQRQIYCADPKHRVQSSRTGFFGSYNYCNTPNNSDGYWDGNEEYQKLAIQCEAENAKISCDFSQKPVDASISYVKADRDFCFKRY